MSRRILYDVHDQQLHVVQLHVEHIVQYITRQVQDVQVQVESRPVPCSSLIRQLTQKLGISTKYRFGLGVRGDPTA